MYNHICIVQSNPIRKNEDYICSLRGRYEAEVVGVRVHSEGEKFALMFSFSTSLLPDPWPHAWAAHWMTQKLVHPGRKLPAFPKGCQSKVHYSSCVFACMFLWERRRKEGDCVNRHTLADSLKCTAEHQRLSFILILAAVCFNKNNPPSLPFSQETLPSLVFAGLLPVWKRSGNCWYANR